MTHRFTAPLAALWAALLFVLPLAAQAPDTTKTEEKPPAPLFTTRDALVAGGFLVGAAALAPFDRALDDALHEPVLQSRRALRGGATFFRLLGHPGVGILSGSAYAAGLITRKRGLADAGLHTIESVLLANVVTEVGKDLVGRARPSRSPDDPYNVGFGRGFKSDDFRSFPSGHSSTAFAAAAAATSEVGHWAPKYHTATGIVLYSGATLVALSRMYNQAHWASDVIIGAAVGTFSGWKMVHYNHARPRNPVDRLLLPSAAIPTDEGGVVLVWSFPH